MNLEFRSNIDDPVTSGPELVIQSTVVRSADMRATILKNGELPPKALAEVEALLVHSEAAQQLNDEIVEFLNIYSTHYRETRESIIARSANFEAALDQLMHDASEAKVWLGDFLANAAHDSLYRDHVETHYAAISETMVEIDKTICELMANRERETELDIEARNIYEQRAEQKDTVITEIREALAGVASTTDPGLRDIRSTFAQNPDETVLPQATEDQALWTDLSQDELQRAQSIHPELYVQYEEIERALSAAEQKYGNRKQVAIDERAKIVELKNRLNAMQQTSSNWATFRDDAVAAYPRHHESLMAVVQQLHFLNLTDDIKARFDSGDSLAKISSMTMPSTSFMKTQLTVESTDADLAEWAQKIYSALANGEAMDDNAATSEYADDVKNLFEQFTTLEKNFAWLKNAIAQDTASKLDALDKKHKTKIILFGRHIGKLSGEQGISSLFREKAIRYDALTQDLSRKNNELEVTKAQIDYLTEQLDQCETKIFETSNAARSFQAQLEAAKARKARMAKDYSVSTSRVNEALIAKASNHDQAAIEDLLMHSDGGHVGYDTDVEPILNPQYVSISTTLIELTHQLEDCQTALSSYSAMANQQHLELEALNRGYEGFRQEAASCVQALNLILTDESYRTSKAVFEAAKNALLEFSAEFYENNRELLEAQEPEVAETPEAVAVPAGVGPNFSAAFEEIDNFKPVPPNNAVRIQSIGRTAGRFAKLKGALTSR